MKKLNLALNLKKYREYLNLSQKEIAKKLEIAPNTYSNYETGRREPSLDILINLSNIFNCSLEDIILDHSLFDPLKNNKLSIFDGLDLNKFSKSTIINQLSTTKNYYEKSLIELNKSIPKKINEIDKLICFVNKSINDDIDSFIKSNENKIKEPTDTSNFISATLDNNLKDGNHRKYKQYFNTEIGMIGAYNYGSIKCGIPTQAYCDLKEYINVPCLLPLSESKEYFILKASGDSMNKLINDGEEMIIEETQDIVDDDIAVLLINGESTLKQFESVGSSAFMLKPLSTNPIHKDQYYDSTYNLVIQGKYICNLKDILDEYNDIIAYKNSCR